MRSSSHQQWNVQFLLKEEEEEEEEEDEDSRRRRCNKQIQLKQKHEMERQQRQQQQEQLLPFSLLMDGRGRDIIIITMAVAGDANEGAHPLLY